MALIPVCDICGERESVAGYEIKGDGKRSNVDLCKTHAEPVKEIMSKGVVAEVAPPTRKAAPAKKVASRSRGSRVTTIEEIEELKGK